MRYLHASPSVARLTAYYPFTPSEFNSETTALEIDRSDRICVPLRLREWHVVGGGAAIIGLHDQLESRSPQEWNNLDLLTWAESVQETPSPDAALAPACMGSRASPAPCLSWPQSAHGPSF